MAHTKHFFAAIASFASICIFPTVRASELFECIVEPNQTASIRSTVAGVISAITVSRGDAVKKNQPLVVLESSTEKTTFDLAQYKAQMSGQIRSAETKFEYAKRTYERRRDMNSQKLMSTQDKEEAERDMKAAEAELQIAKENHQTAILEMNEQESVLKKRTILSPFNGVVVDQLLYPGEVTDLSDPKKPILKLAQIDPLVVRIVAPRSAFGKVKRGSAISITPEIPANSNIKAIIKTVDPIIDAASGTFVILAHLANPKGEIPVGIRCQARLQ